MQQSAYKKLINFTDDLVRNYHDSTLDGYEIDFNKISKHEKVQLSMLIIKKDGLESLYENCGFDKLPLFKFLNVIGKDQMIDNAYEMQEALENILIKTYEQQMKHLLTDRCSDVESEDHYEITGKFFSRDDRGLYA